VTFAGSPDRAEARLVPDAGFELDTLPRRPGVALARALVVAAAAPVACARILRRRRPDVVLGGGGYVSGPMVLAAALQRVPTAVMEADAHLGLANRLAAPMAERVFLALPIDGLDGAKYRVTGRPVPRRSRPVERGAARRTFDLPETGPLLLVLGGSQGARALNELAVETWGGAGPAVLHLSGERDFESVRDRVTRADYRLLPFTDEIGAAYGAADLALARAGGGIWELAAAGVPAVLVPFPHATSDHQTKNALHFERAGGVVVVPESELPRAPSVVEDLLADTARRGRMAAAMRTAARPRAAGEVAEGLIAIATA
jgi:UDP-N-acetylglucosamine--N-acetylmuramyl-(pentapeptide) pyrophosphoryl-undecaprenol N-acetylglucosamine transferase